MKHFEAYKMYVVDSSKTWINSFFFAARLTNFEKVRDEKSSNGSNSREKGQWQPLGLKLNKQNVRREISPENNHG